MPAAGGSDPNQPEPQERDGAATGFQSWSAEGSRPSVIDPRRRLGGHGQARRLLVVDHGAAAMAQGVWRGLLSALQRHTVQSALVEMTAEERDVLTLAYQEGRTNSEIASVMGVSGPPVISGINVLPSRVVELTAVTPDAPNNDPTKTGAEAGPPAVKTTGGSDESNEASDQESRGSLGCHGNPTSAPPPVPVGPRGDHPSGAPVTHPGPGGCKSD